MTSLLEEFQQVGRDLYAAGLVSSHGGNMSVRQGEGLIITSHGSRLGHLADQELVEVGSGSEPRVEPSMDLALHQAIYAASTIWASCRSSPGARTWPRLWPMPCGSTG